MVDEDGNLKGSVGEKITSTSKNGSSRKGISSKNETSSKQGNSSKNGSSKKSAKTSASGSRSVKTKTEKAANSNINNKQKVGFRTKDYDTVKRLVFGEMLGGDGLYGAEEVLKDLLASGEASEEDCARVQNEAEAFWKKRLNSFGISY